MAGTNGKGSTCAYLAEMARAKGETVHIYTSPHLVDFNERILINSVPVDDNTLIEAFARCEAANFGEPITFFEITTAAALLLFSEHPADRLILEVGLGGRYDATNVITRPALSVITPVSLDHQEFLGDDLAQIAREKAGICKFGVPVVVGNQSGPAEAAILDEAAKVGAPAFVWGRDYNAYMQHGRLVYEDENRVWDLPAPGLLGPHQILNAGAAAAAAAVLQWPESSAASGIANANWPARLQNITRGPLGEIASKAGAELWLDGGHNEAAARGALPCPRRHGRARGPSPGHHRRLLAEQGCDGLVPPVLRSGAPADRGGIQVRPGRLATGPAGGRGLRSRRGEGGNGNRAHPRDEACGEGTSLTAHPDRRLALSGRRSPRPRRRPAAPDAGIGTLPPRMSGETGREAKRAPRRTPVSPFRSFEKR